MGRLVTGCSDADPDCSPERRPTHRRRSSRPRFATPPPAGLRVTWFGHSTMLIEIDGTRVLTDPVWSERASPLPWSGPQRWYPPPIALAELPPLDAVVISHDHYDHLDHATIVALKDWDTTFVVPLGVGAHLDVLGRPRGAHRRARLVGARRASARSRSSARRRATPRAACCSTTTRTLWAGYALLGAAHRVYYSGDTGLFPAMRDIGERLGPFDLTMIEVGQYNRAWPDWHIGPEQAVRAHGMVRGEGDAAGALGPASRSRMHGWTEPIERVLAAAARAGVRDRHAAAGPERRAHGGAARGALVARSCPGAPGGTNPIVAGHEGRGEVVARTPGSLVNSTLAASASVRGVIGMAYPS